MRGVASAVPVTDAGVFSGNELKHSDVRPNDLSDKNATCCVLVLVLRQRHSHADSLQPLSHFHASCLEI